MTGSKLLQNKKLLTALLLVCLGLNSQIGLLPESQNSGSTSFSSETETKSNPKCHGEVKTFDISREEAIFASKYHDDVYDIDEDDNERDRLIVSPSKSNKNVNFKFSYCVAQKSSKKEKDKYIVTDVNVEGKILDCNGCIALDGTINISDINDIKKELNKLVDDKLEDKVKSKVALKEFRERNKILEDNCEGKERPIKGGFEFIYFSEFDLENELNESSRKSSRKKTGQESELSCLLSKLKKTKGDDNKVQLYEDRIEEILQSLSQGDASSRKIALKLIKSIKTKSSRSYKLLPLAIQSSLQSVELFIHQKNNIAKAYKPYFEKRTKLELQRKQLATKICPPAGQPRTFNCLSETQYKLAINQIDIQLSQLNQAYSTTLGQLDQLKQNDVNGFRNEFSNSEVAENKLTPFLNEINQEFNQQMSYIGKAYSSSTQTTNPTVANNGNLNRAFDNSAVTNITNNGAILGGYAVPGFLSGQNTPLLGPTRK